MRVSITFEIVDSNVNGGKKVYSIPMDYRRGIISIIKNSVENYSASLFKKLFLNKDKPISKQYTFSVWFGRRMNIANDMIYFNSPITLNFTSLDSRFITILGNRAIYSLGKDKYIDLYGLKLRCSRIAVKNDPIFEGKTFKFKTLSPVIFRKHDNETNKDKYLIPGENGFEDAYNQVISKLISEIGSVKGKNIPAFEPVSTKKVVIKHLGLNLRGFVGIFQLKGDPEVIKVLYQIGLGSRRNQGFGMFEICE